MKKYPPKPNLNHRLGYNSYGPLFGERSDIRIEDNMNINATSSLGNSFDS
jgi:hypothetical protein